MFKKPVLLKSIRRFIGFALVLFAMCYIGLLFMNRRMASQNFAGEPYVPEDRHRVFNSQSSRLSGNNFIKPATQADLEESGVRISPAAAFKDENYWTLFFSRDEQLNRFYEADPEGLKVAANVGKNADYYRMMADMDTEISKGRSQFQQNPGGIVFKNRLEGLFYKKAFIKFLKNKWLHSKIPPQ